MEISVNWSAVSATTTTTPTFQNSVDSYYRMDDGADV